MKVRILVAALATVGFAQIASAANGDAGCGLGSLIIQDNTKLMQILAATTNGSFGSQTFGITTGTSNCTAQNFVMRDKAVQYFAEVNQADLNREMAQGSGEKLATLASLYGCHGTATSAFAKMTQDSYGTIVPSADVKTSEMVGNLNKVFDSHPEVSGSCKI